MKLKRPMHSGSERESLVKESLSGGRPKPTPAWHILDRRWKLTAPSWMDLVHWKYCSN
jgi:hypothetical protein